MNSHARKMDFSDITVRPEDNARHVYRGIEELAADIEKAGLLQPLVVYERKQKNTRAYILRAGFRRHRAIELIRKRVRGFMAEVPVIVRHGNEMDALGDNLRENIQRESLTPGEIAQGIARMATGLKVPEIAESLGLSKTYVGNLLKAWQAFDQSARVAFMEGSIPVDVAFQLATEPPTRVSEVLSKARTKAASGGTSRKGSGNGRTAPNGHAKAKDVPDAKAVRKAVREETRTRPTVRQIDAFVKEHCTEEAIAKEDFWRGVLAGLEWAIGRRGSAPNATA